MLTPKENAIFRPLVTAAWRAHCARFGADPTNAIAREHWYRKTLLDAAGVYTTKEIPGGHGDPRFAAACLDFATIAGDDTAITYWSRDAERRALWRLRQLQQRLRVDDHYVLSIATRMSLLPDNHAEDWLQDMPAEHLLRICTALSIHTTRRAASAASEAKKAPVQSQPQEVPF